MILRGPHHAIRDMMHFHPGVPGAVVPAPGIADATDLAHTSMNASILRHETQGMTKASRGGADMMLLQDAPDATDHVRVSAMTIRRIRVHGAAQVDRDIADMTRLHQGVPCGTDLLRVATGATTRDPGMQGATSPIQVTTGVRGVSREMMSVDRIANLAVTSVLLVTRGLNRRGDRDRHSVIK
jgi:hypothetical protein